jgi:AraC-like DNA-binding protein
MREMLLSLPHISQKFIYVEQYLLKQYGKKLEPNPFIDFAVNKILQSTSPITIEGISKKVGYSQKHFIKMFKEKVGLTPKGFLKIIRFQKAIQEIEACKKINWPGIAYESGYYDQAHFINDFKTFSGFTPRQYLLLKNDQVNYVPVG